MEPKRLNSDPLIRKLRSAAMLAIVWEDQRPVCVKQAEAGMVLIQLAVVSLSERSLWFNYVHAISLSSAKLSQVVNSKKF